MKFGLDAYDRGARLSPAYLVFAPMVVFVVALSLGTPAWWTKVGGVLAACGAPVLAVQWGRSGGRSKQTLLFESWGGPPTVRLLRFAGASDHQAVEQRHDAVERATGITLPSQHEEAADPSAADALYGTGVTALRELTRDPKLFPLVLYENIAYGFRRNLWGRKAWGIAVAVATLAVSVLLLTLAFAGHELVEWQSAAVAGAFALIALAIWVTTVRPEWVRQAADAYSIRLLESAIRLPRRPKL